MVYQSPYTTKEGEVPHNLYLICHDPYAQSKSTSNESLGAAYVIKRPNNLSKPDDIIVASYVGRPQTQDEYNRNLFMLAEYYNAKSGSRTTVGSLLLTRRDIASYISYRRSLKCWTNGNSDPEM